MAAYLEKNSKICLKLKNEVQIIFFLSKTIAFSLKLMKRRFQDLHKKINLDNFCRSYGN